MSDIFMGKIKDQKIVSESIKIYENTFRCINVHLSEIDNRKKFNIL